MDADQKKAEKKAKIAAEMERMKAKKAAANAGGAAKAEATTFQGEWSCRAQELATLARGTAA